MRMLTYYDKAGGMVMEIFFETLKEINIELSVLEMAKFTYNNCYNLLCSTPDQENNIDSSACVPNLFLLNCACGQFHKVTLTSQGVLIKASCSAHLLSRFEEYVTEQADYGPLC